MSSDDEAKQTFLLLILTRATLGLRPVAAVSQLARTPFHYRAQVSNAPIWRSLVRRGREKVFNLLMATMDNSVAGAVLAARVQLRIATVNSPVVEVDLSSNLFG